MSRRRIDVEPFGSTKVTYCFLPTKSHSDEVRVEIARLEEPDAPLAHIAKQVEFPILEEILVPIVELSQIEDEVPLAVVQRDGANFNQLALAEMQQWLIQVISKPIG